MQSKKLFQKTSAFLLIMAVPIFIITNFSILKSKKDLSCEFTSEFIPTNEYLSEKSFVFMIFGSEKAKSCEQNLSSIFHQKYNDYRIIFLTKNPHSECAKSLRTLAAKEGKSDRLSFCHTESSFPTIETFRKALDNCRNDEIVVQMNSTDWLAHENVLTKLNQIYSSSNEIWLTYSQYLEYPSYKKGTIEPYLKKMLRNRQSNKAPWLSSHFKTYYVGLFKQIEPDSKFTYKRSLGHENLDLYMLPMVEQSKNHILYIDDILYIHTIKDS